MTEQLKTAFLPMDTAPHKDREHEPFLVLRDYGEKAELTRYVVVQVSWFEGTLYPDDLQANIDRSDHVSNAIGWLPMPGTPTVSKAEEGTQDIAKAIDRLTGLVEWGIGEWINRPTPLTKEQVADAALKQWEKENGQF